LTSVVSRAGGLSSISHCGQSVKPPKWCKTRLVGARRCSRFAIAFPWQLLGIPFGFLRTPVFSRVRIQVEAVWY
jgi:hypothetical protein